MPIKCVPDDTVTFFLLPPRPCCCPGTSPPLAHEVAMRVSSCAVLAWCVVCGVHEAASVGVGVGQPSPSCLVVRPFVVALPTVRSFVSPGAAPCAYSCSAHVRPCAQGRCGRCPLGSGVMPKKKFFFLPFPQWCSIGAFRYGHRREMESGGWVSI